jgi:glycosyltransferase involved in cell wall biosynthesis
MKKTIWYISKYFERPSESSPGGRGFLLLKEMAAQGANVTAIISDSNNLVKVPELISPILRENLDGVQLVWLRTMSYPIAKSARRILSWLHFEERLFLLDKSSLPRPDVIIVSSLSLLTILNGLMLRSKFNCKLVFEVRDIWPLTIVEEGGFSEKNPFVRMLAWIERLGYRKADWIVGTMPNLGAHVRNVLGYDRPTHCVPMGIAPDTLNSLQDPLSEDYFKKYVPGERFIVAYAGTIGITNALDIFFKCAERMIDRKKIHFLVLGDGALKEEFIKIYGHLPNLTFAPRVKKNQVQSVLKRCDLLYFSVYPSKVWDYGQSLNKVIDYMLSGKPILASFSGFPSMIDQADCGRFIEAGNIPQLISEIETFSQLPAERCAAMGGQGRQWLLDHRSYKRLAAEYLELISR